MQHNPHRRRFLAGVGGAAAAALLGPGAAAAVDPSAGEGIDKTTTGNGELPAPQQIERRKLEKPVTAIIIGHGGRGGVYGRISQRLKDEWKIVGVAEPIAYRNEAAAKAYEIPAEHRFETWEDVFQRPKFADVCVISTPDDLHHGPAMAALAAGYDLLLEKPIAMTWQQCQDIAKKAKEKDAIVGVCHVLRYGPYFRQLHAVVRSGMIGDVVSVQHLEPIEHIHMSHSFVRGIWRNQKVALPIILAKSCHDLDLLRWIVDKPCQSVSSMGGLSFFREAHAPEGAPKFCLDGCPAAETCPYYAPRVYVTEKLWSTGHIVTEDRSPEGIMEALKTSQYGRCVFRTDNDQPDHQVTNLQFEGGATVSFAMEAMTNYGGRLTRVMGTKGDVVGDGRTLEVFEFVPRRKTEWDVRKAAEDLSGHGGGDAGLVADFVQAVSRRDASLLSSNLEASMASHLMGFRAEESRRAGGQLLEVRA